jgi:hypothetical protein
LTGEQKIDYIAKQIRAAKEDRQNQLKCPYCEAFNKKGEPLCCELFAKACAAILVNNWDKERADTAERIMEKVSQN